MAQRFVVKCCMSDHKQDIVVVKVRKKESAEKRLNSLLSKIPLTIKTMKTIDPSKWTLRINGTVIKRNDHQKFQALTANCNDIDIVQYIPKGNESSIIIHYNGQEMEYIINEDMDGWNNETYLKLLDFIKNGFDLSDDLSFKIYEDVSGSHVDIDTIGDIKSIFEDIESDSDSDNDGSDTDGCSAHIHVQRIQCMRFVYESQSFNWTPSNPDNDDEKEWNDNYTNLMILINSKFELKEKMFTIQQIQDGAPCPIPGGEDLMFVWEELKENDSICADVDVIAVSDSDNDDDDATKTEPPIPNPSGNQEEEPVKSMIDKPPIATDNDEDEDAVKEWLTKIKMSQYFDVLVKAGYDDLDYFDATLDHQDLIDAGIDRKPHRKRILSEIKNKPNDCKEVELQVQVAESKENEDGSDDNGSDGDDMNLVEQNEKNKENEHKEELMDVDTDDESSEAKDDGKEPEQMIVDMDDNSLTIDDKLSKIGSNIGLLKDPKKKKLCYGLVCTILDTVNHGDDDCAEDIESMVQQTKKESSQFAQCIAAFLRMLGYSLKNGRKLKGKLNTDILESITSNFHHLEMAMQKPKQNVYQELEIKIPNKNKMITHKSGINDNQFITFLLPQVVLENQQTSLVNKVVLNPHYLHRFINFLQPGASKYLCKEIYFEKLKKLKISPIGLFGSRLEVLNMLRSYNAISDLLYSELLADNKNKLIQPGIHAIMPVDLQMNDDDGDDDAVRSMKSKQVIYLFYWTLVHSFDMNRMKVKLMRKDPACLLSRVLYEISNTVCIQVSSSELNDFGVIKQPLVEFQDLQKKKKKKPRRGIKLDFVVEETKENQIMCVGGKTYSKTLDSVVQKKKNNHLNEYDVFLLNGTKMSGYCSMLETKQTTVDDMKLFKGSEEVKVISFLQHLHDKYVIEWKVKTYREDGFSDDGLKVLAQAVAPEAYNTFKKETSSLKDDMSSE